jgi:hypothetical protein
MASPQFDYQKQIVDSDGNILGTTANPLVTSVGTAAASLGKAEDAAHASGDTGVMLLAVRKDTAAALAGADGDYIPLIVGADGRLWVNAKALRSSTGTKSNVGGAATSTTILASNANRLGMSIYNDSAAILYLDTTGGTASATSYTAQVAPGGYYEMPFHYTGLVTGIWASATGTARVVEYT